MIATDEDALICDLAETYGVFDYESLPVNLVATFACGLRDNARIRQKLRGEELDTETLLSAILIDRVTDLGHGLGIYTKQPKSMVDLLAEKEAPVTGYDTAEDFMAARERIING